VAATRQERTGKSDLDTYLDRFVARLRARLEVGAREYGDRSFTRPAAEGVDEVQQELEDVAGWGLLLWIRLERLRGRVEHLDEGGTDGRS
jgi:hypothetical protein